MKRFVEGVDRGQSTLFPDRLEDWIGDDNAVRVVDVFVDELDLGGLGFDRVAPLATGRPSYHPSVLLKLYIYGYLNRVQSSRRLERESPKHQPVSSRRSVSGVVATSKQHNSPDPKVLRDLSSWPATGQHQAHRRALELRRKPDSFVSFHDGPRGNAEVKWVMPGLVERGGLTITFAKENFGKTALVMSELWRASQRRDCNVLYLAFENHNGLDARCEALEQHYDSAPSFIAEKASWDLGELDQWSHVAELVEDRQQHFALFNEAPLVVVFDTMGAAILESSRIMTGAERFYSGLRQMIGVPVSLPGSLGMATVKAISSDSRVPSMMPML